MANWWPWGRSTQLAPDPAAVQPAVLPAPAWRTLAALQRSVGDIDTTADLNGFTSSLTTSGNPSLTTPLQLLSTGGHSIAVLEMAPAHGPSAGTPPQPPAATSALNRRRSFAPNIPTAQRARVGSEPTLQRSTEPAQSLPEFRSIENTDTAELSSHTMVVAPPPDDRRELDAAAEAPVAEHISIQDPPTDISTDVPLVFPTPTPRPEPGIAPPSVQRTVTAGEVSNARPMAVDAAPLIAHAAPAAIEGHYDIGGSRPHRHLTPVQRTGGVATTHQPPESRPLPVLQTLTTPIPRAVAEAHETLSAEAHPVDSPDPVTVLDTPPQRPPASGSAATGEFVEPPAAISASPPTAPTLPARSSVMRVVDAPNNFTSHAEVPPTVQRRAPVPSEVPHPARAAAPPSARPVVPPEPTVQRLHTVVGSAVTASEHAERQDHSAVSPARSAPSGAVTSGAAPSSAVTSGAISIASPVPHVLGPAPTAQRLSEPNPTTPTRAATKPDAPATSSADAGELVGNSVPMTFAANVHRSVAPPGYPDRPMPPVAQRSTGSGRLVVLPAVRDSSTERNTAEQSASEQARSVLYESRRPTGLQRMFDFTAQRTSSAAEFSSAQVSAASIDQRQAPAIGASPESTPSYGHPTDQPNEHRHSYDPNTNTVTFAALSMQREPEAPPAPAPPATTPATPSTTAGATQTTPPAAPAVDVDDLVHRLYDPLAARLRAELWLDRERAGVLMELG